MSEIITATVASDDIVVNVNETLLYKGDKGDKGDTGSIENLKIGGVNLLNDTKYLHAMKNFGSNYDIVTSEKYRGFTVRGGTIPNKPDQPILQYDGISGFELGDTFTFSFYAKGTTNSIDVYFFGESGYVKAKAISTNGNIYSKNFGDGHVKFNISQNKWKRYYCAWKLDSEGDKSIAKTILLRCDGTSNVGKEVFVCAPKLEREETPTDWTPSLEDYETKFNNIIARLEALESK